MLDIKELQRTERHKRLRRNLMGTTDRPRLCVHRSHKNFSAQLVDDLTGKVLFGKSTLSKDVRAKVKKGNDIEAATFLGTAFASQAVSKGIKEVAFDRGGYPYHGRVKAFAEAARQAGLEF